MAVTDLGFEVEPDVLTAVEVSHLAKMLETVESRSRAGARHLMSQPAVAKIASDFRLLALARRWLGPTATPYRATLFDKSPGSNWLTVWHQDTALPLRFRREVAGWGPWSVKAGVLYAHAPAGVLEGIAALRVHLDDSLPENGPLRLLPGTHHSGVLSDDAIHDLVSRFPAQLCVVRRGGIMAMRPLLLHASSKSTSIAPRKVLHIEYAASLQLGSDLELDVA
jgi:ectoine hydroxylase-related dioxygenase (phytanoyl-CoA dioxygenase family)